MHPDNAIASPSIRPVIPRSEQERRDRELAAKEEKPSAEALASQKRFDAKVAEQDKAAAAEEQAEFNAHPHTRLTALAADLGTKRVDLHDRIGAIHRVLAGLIGMALQNTPKPHREDDHDEKRNDAVGPEGQGPTGG